jgi:hypothetical protein
MYLIIPAHQNSGNDSYLNGNFKIEEFSFKDLLKWESWGKGIVANGSHKQLIMSETDSSKGVMIVSPDIYGKNVILSYDVMILRPATVLIVELLAHNNENFDLDLLDDYDGNVQFLFENVKMYMFAFHNAAHNKPGPFIRKYPEPGPDPLVTSIKPYLRSGIYYHIELGKIEDRLFFKVDGKTVLEKIDSESYDGGKIILRIRGTGHEKASCLIRNVKIYSKD